MKEWIGKTFHKNTKLQIIIGTAVVILCLMIWPFAVFSHARTVGDYQSNQAGYTGAVTMEEVALISLSPLSDHISEISIACKVSEVSPQDRVFVTIFDSTFEIYWQEVVYFTEIEPRGYLYVKPEIDVAIGETYYLNLNVHFASTGTFELAYESDHSDESEIGPLWYAGEELSGKKASVQLKYTAPYSIKRKGFYTLLVLLGGGALYLLCSFLMGLLEAKNKEKVLNYGKIILFAGLGLFLDGVLFFRACVRKVYGNNTATLKAFALGCIAVLLLICWGVLSGFLRKKSQGQITWKAYLQMLAAVGIMHAGIGYVNAGIQWEQDMYRNWVCILFGILILLAVEWKDKWTLLKIPTVVATLVTAWFATVPAMIVVWTVLLLSTFLLIRKNIRGSWNLFFALSWLGMSIMMMIFAYGKVWVFLFAGSFLIFYLQGFSDDNRAFLLHNFMNGVLLHFGILVVLCLCYRPFHMYRFSRYPMWFHTVASTGMYLALVVAVSTVRLFLKMKETGTVILGTMKEWSCELIVLSYVLLSMTRTTILSVVGVMLALLVGTLAVYRPHIIRYVQVGAVFLAGTAMSLVMVFTLQRCIPAEVNRPVFVNDIEEDSGSIVVGEKKDSPKYMNFEMLLEFWQDRLGMPKFVSRLFVTTDMDRNGLNGFVCRSVDVASTQEGAGMEPSTQLSYADEISNGRTFIFKGYLDKLTWNGHKSALLEINGEEFMHSHNSYLQQAYDFGIAAGILFLLLSLGMPIRAVFLIWSGRDRSESAFLQLILGTTYLITGLTEYASNPFMPLGFAFFFVLFTMRKEKNVL